MIKIAQYKGRSLTSKIIRFATRGEYSHTAIILTDGVVVEAWQGCNSVRVVLDLSDGHKAGTEVDIYSVPFTREQEDVFVEYIGSQIGSKYDYWGLLAFFANKAKWDRADKNFCSELFYNGCIKVGFRLFAPDVLGWQVSPSMLTRTPEFTLIDKIITH